MSKITNLKPFGLRDLQLLLAGKTVDRVYVWGGNMFAIRFTDGTVLDLATDDRFGEMCSAIDEAIGRYSCNFGCAGRMKNAAATLAAATPQIRASVGYQEEPS